MTKPYLFTVPRKRVDEPAAGLNRSKLKLSKWAEEYERGQGKIRCPQRERNHARRYQRRASPLSCGTPSPLRYMKPRSNCAAAVTLSSEAAQSGHVRRVLAADECYYGQQPDAARRCDQPTMSLPHETVLLLLILIVRARLVKGVAAPLDLTGASGVGARVLLDCPTVVLCDPHDFREEQA